MSRIRILPDILANKIAAGEVVERPASVIKELVENALDAGGTRILIEIENGGRALMQVADNGSGMGHDDALLALERFATSKLHSDADLAAIRTLGFRGEALPSIAAISKLTLVTREADADHGVQVQVQGGKIVQVSEAGAPQGTLISVAQLFYNTPARRKFMKSAAVEMGHIADTVAAMALGSPQVHFKLIHNGREVKQWSKAGDPAGRAADVLALASKDELIALDGTQGEMRLAGWVAPPRLARSTSRGTYVFVNGRRVRDRIVQHALFEGFHGRIMKGQFPLAVLFLHLPFDQVDVNVHPAKHEVRFADQRSVHALVQRTVAEALARAERRPLGRIFSDEQPPRQTGEPLAAYKPFEVAAVATPGAPAEAPDGPEIHPAALSLADFDDPSPSPSFESRPGMPTAAAQGSLWTARGFARATILGQFRGTYIICEDEEGLLLIDQHAAHERIVFERLVQGRPQVQQLLVPETVEVGFAEAEMLEQLMPALAGIGLEIEPFGRNTFIIKCVPTLLDNQDLSRLVRALAETSVEIGMKSGLDKIMESCRMLMACHNAVRAHQHLSDLQIRRMLEQLDQCANTAHCPHGRPIWIRWTLRDLEKAFGRTG